MIKFLSVLREVHVQGFKSLADVRIELGILNVFVGANGSGKTNLLEALGLLGAAVFGHVDDDSLKLRGVRPGLPTLYKTAFKSQKIRRVITIEASSDSALYRVVLTNPIKQADSAWRFNNEWIGLHDQPTATRSEHGARLHLRAGPQKADIDGDRGLVPLARTINRDPALRHLLDLIERYAIYTPYTPMLRGTTEDPTPKRPLGLTGGGLADAVRELDRPSNAKLQQLVRRLIDWSDQVGSGTAAQAQLSPSVRSTANVLRFHDRFMGKGRDWLSGYDASEGALYVTFLALLALHAEAPHFAAIDNVDQALNPRLAAALIGEIQDVLLEQHEPRQFLLTAHNASVLDALRLADDRVRLFVVDRNNKGATVVHRIPHSDALAQAEAEGLTLSRLWLGGFLGGMPRL